MSLSPGTRLGPYEILGRLGAGGMGEVFRARDTRLQRTVAIKLLPAELAADPERKQRFEREARAVAALSHPHICTLFDVGQAEGREFLVMEYLEGQTLAERVEQGPLPIDQVLRYGTEMAQALEEAHRHGIVHRDLKPANVMVTGTGVKLLDFGLAKLREATETSEDTATDTDVRVATPLTERGMVMGTLPYMAPEQLEGEEPDARTDIFALGLVLYEMATGRKAFSGKSRASLAAAILHDEPPPLSSLQPQALPGLERVVKTCLAKDPDARWQTAREVALALGWVSDPTLSGPTGITAGGERRRPRAWWVALAGAVVLALGVVAVLSPRRDASRVQPFHLSLAAPAGVAQIGQMAVAPDSRRIAFVGIDGASVSRLWTADLTTGGMHVLAGTEGAFDPFWSPDSGQLGYFSSGSLASTQSHLYRVEAAGASPPQRICAAPRLPAGGAWGPDGTILFGFWESGEIMRVAALGGAPVPLTRIDTAKGEDVHMWPSFLPDGRHFLYFAEGGEDGAVRLGSLAGGPAPVLLEHEFSPAVVASGRLVLVREGNLTALAFDGARVSGAPRVLATKVRWDDRNYWFFAANDRVLAVRRGEAKGQLRWYDRKGAALAEVGEPADDVHLDLSGDGRFLALERLNANRRGGEVWVRDLERDVETRITDLPGWKLYPVWSPDGRISYSVTGERPGMYIQAPNAVRPPEGLKGFGTYTNVQSWSPDGRYAAAEDPGASSGADVLVYPAGGDRPPIVIARTAAWENEAQFSPDGALLAYCSDGQVYLQPFPPTGDRWQVPRASRQQPEAWSSRDPCGFPRWRGDGRELYFVGPDETITAVDVIRRGGSVTVGAPRPLFKVALKLFQNRYPYAVARDGQRFLVNTEKREPPVLDVVVDWASGLPQ